MARGYTGERKDLKAYENLQRTLRNNAKQSTEQREETFEEKYVSYSSWLGEVKNEASKKIGLPSDDRMWRDLIGDDAAKALKEMYANKTDIETAVRKLKDMI